MKILSSAFEDNNFIPSQYTCDGNNVNPPLTFSQVPKEAKSLVLIVDDPDAPSKTWVHWVLYNMPPTTIQIVENYVPEKSMVGMTDFGKLGYGGPCPPSGTHRYFFKLYALDLVLTLSQGATKQEVEDKMQNHILASSQLVGIYKRQ